MPITSTTSPPQQIRRFPQEVGSVVYGSPPSSLSSDDEETEFMGRRIQPIPRRRTPGKTLDWRKINGTRNPSVASEFGDYTTSRRMPRFQRQTRGLSRHRSPSIPEQSSEVFVTTMDEDDQQMFIALFYWRRKVIETHFSAWKWVVFTLRRSAKQIHRYGVNTRLSKSILTGPPRRNLILKRHTGRLSSEESEASQVADNYEKLVQVTKQSLHGIDVPGIKEMSPHSPTKDDLVDAYPSEKRRQFRAQLRLVYVCFGQWKSTVEESRRRRVHQLIQATDFHRSQQLKSALRAWRCGNRIHKLKRNRLNAAHRFHWDRTKRFVFCEWKRYCRVEREISRRQNVNAVQQKRLSLQHWYQCIVQTRKCRDFVANRCHNRLRNTFRYFRVGVHRAKGERLQRAAATLHSQARRQRTFLRSWREAVFEDPSYLSSIDHGTRVSLSSGVRKWRKFINARQLRSRKVLLADFFRYRASLRRAFRGWGQFLEWTRQRKLLYDEVELHHRRKLKLEGIRKLGAAACANRIQRGQVRMATRWHQRKLVARLFEIWISSARECGRVRTFRCAVDSRRLNNVFRSWCKLIAVSKRLRSKKLMVSICWNECVLRTYMTKWVRLQHINSFISSLGSKRRNLSTVNHFHAWRTLCTNKMLLKNAVEQQRQRIEAALLERVVSKWFGVTLKKRCLKRLVKLFRKKQARHRVRSIFRLWKVHSHVCIATRKRDRDQVRLSLEEWKQACRKCKESRMTMAVAAQYYRERRYVMAVEQWLAFTGQRVQTRKTERRALTHYFGRILISSLQRWYIAARELRRQKEFLRHRRQLRDEQVLTRCLYTWYTAVRQRIQRRARGWTALQFHVENLQRRSFYAWQNFQQARLAWNEEMCLAAVTYDNSLQGSVLRGWHIMVRERIRRKLRHSLVQKAVGQRRLRSSVARWFSYRCERRRRRKQNAAAETFFNEYVLCLTMYRWQHLWFKTSMLRQNKAKVATQINALRLTRAVAQWRENYRYNSSIREKKSKASQLCTTKILTKHFQTWKCYHNAMRHKVSRRRFVARLRHQKLLSRMFRRWRQYSEISTLARLQHHQAAQHRTASVLRLAFHGWKRYRSNRTLQLMAYFHRRRFVLQKVWTTWLSRLEYTANVRRNILVTNQLLRSNLFRATFVRWKSYTSRHIKHQIQLCRSEDHHVRRLYRRAVSRWRKRIRFQRAVAQAALLGQTNKAKQCWRRWNRYVATKSEQKCRRVLAEQTYHQNRQRRHFTGWKTLTKRCLQGRREKSDALYRVSCLKMAWARWHRVIGWRRRIATMECRRLDYLQATILRRWRAHTHYRVEKKKTLAMVAKFQQRKLRRKTWRSWLRYMTRCHEKQKQLVWVLSYYSVEVLLRQSLVSWRKLVTIQHAHRESNEIAASFNTHQLVYQGYRKWRAFVELRKVKLEQSEALLQKCEALVLSRSVRRWRTQSAIWHQQRQSDSTATRFYRRKRLASGLNELLSWSDSQKNTRELTIQAKHFRNGKSTAACFRCWQRYHQWRAKYAHLACVFKENQKADSFARWKLYWQSQQTMNEKQLQARVFHCVHVEQRLLSAWMEYLRARKQKKVALAFNTGKVNRAMFGFWKHRAHVLRQMRKMFLYQESFRAQTHFGAWKRYLLTRKQMNERLRKAMRFRSNLRKAHVWQKWNAWVSIQRQERETIKLAVAFRQRFFSRKSFAVWRKRAAYWRRKRALANQALRHYQERLVCRSLQSFVDWRQSIKRLARLQRELAALLIEKRKRLAISTLRALCAETNRKQALAKQACRHWQRYHQLKYWGCAMQWFRVAQHRKLQGIQADAFARTNLLRRCLAAVRVHIVHVKQVKARVDAFRCRFFRSVADDCFFQWRAFATFKQKLRVLRRKTLQSERRQRLQHWHLITVEQVRRRTRMQQIAAKRRQRELLCWFNHWESVCTDLWLEKELVTHHQRHAHKRRLLRCGINALSAQLPARHERQKCSRFFLQHHRHFIIQILQQWRQATSTCDV